MIPMSGYEDKDTEIFGTNSLYNREVHIRAQKKQKKVPGLFGSYPEKPLSLHPLREKNTAPGRKKTVLRNFEKSSKIFWRFGNLTYLCTRFE